MSLTKHIQYFCLNALQLRLFILVLLSICLMMGGIKPVIAQIQTEQGLLENLILQIVEEMPRRGSGGYVNPTFSERKQFEQAISLVKEDRINQANEIFQSLDYNLTIFTDTGSSPSSLLYVISEEQPITKGWGTYIFRPDSRANVHIQVPHPIFDTNTPIVGIRAFNGLKAAYFSMAGTHRYANGEPELNPDSDMARNQHSIFQMVHTLWSDADVAQIHGFNDSNPAYTNYPEAILSNGTLSPQNLLYHMRTQFINRQITAEVFDEQTRDRLFLLAATRNVQGHWSAVNNHHFVHIELARHLRLANYQIGQVVLALHESFTTAQEEDENTQPETPEAVLLNQNYPNPFNHGTIITYSIDQPGDATIQIFDLNGRLVHQSRQVHTSAGDKQFQFLANGLASGSYIYTLTFNNGYSTVKLQKNMILLK